MAGDCTCRQCCARQSITATAFVDPLLVFEPFDYYGERNHRVLVGITFDKRPPGDTTSPRFWWKPVTVSTLAWCDANGENKLAELRIRVEVGQAHEFDSNARPATGSGYGSHTMTHRDDAGNLGSIAYPPNTELAEVRLYAEVLVDNAVQQSYRLINIPEVETLPHRFANAGGGGAVNYLSVEWRFALHDGKLYASVYANAGMGLGPDRDSYVAFPAAVFSPQSVGVPAHNRMAVSRSSQVLTEVVAYHYAKRRSIFKSPCIPDDTSPYCGQGELAEKRQEWPWRWDGECTVWEFCNNIIGSRHNSAKTGLSLTIPQSSSGAGPFLLVDNLFAAAVSSLLSGTYELTQYQGSDPLANSAFWFADQPDSAFTAELSGVQYTFRLKAIEISAVLDFNSVPINTAPCSANAWTPTARLLVSWAVENPAALHNAYGQFARYTHRIAAPVNVSFLEGNSVSFDATDFRPQRGADGFGPFDVAPWPPQLVYNPTLSYSGQWSMQLVT